MKETDFIKQLEQRAKEQETIMKGMIMPKMFMAVCFWFGNHPWRFLIPLAFLLSLIFHFSFGHGYDNLILRIFGGPAR
ncbi:MAG TPA: hypothetical protein VF820_03970 [Patescibacteria group bacterium]